VLRWGRQSSFTVRIGRPSLAEPMNRETLQYFALVRRFFPALAIALVGSALLPALAAAAPPAVISFAPTQVRNQEATVRFAIDPGGLETTWLVELGRTVAYGKEGAGYNWPLSPSSGFVPVEQLIGSKNGNWGPLIPGAEYHYRVVAMNADGTTYGEDQTLMATNGTPPAASNLSAIEVAPGVVVLNGAVDPEGSPVTVCRFHYITEETFQHKGFSAYGFPLGEVVPCADPPWSAGDGTEPVPVHVALSGLKPGVYYFLTEAENAYDEGTTTKSIRFEITAPAVGPAAAKPDDPATPPRPDQLASPGAAGNETPATSPAPAKATPHQAKKQQRKKKHRRQRHHPRR
jgi:hypothetical protein